ncbi:MULTISPECIES: thioesterase family protein [unclassified Virgibacillus]|uniref:acyl-CoA thioesterase n=1 Tax=unclassified Virgibacillus TaxID=2620237 RepID=UPI0024DE3863|nr:thioesterase family protein [Virgibacillus sp. LDC-1]
MKASYINDLEAWKSEFSFYIPITIRFSETDMFGHVNNVSPFIYFEEARIAYMRSCGLFTDLKGNEGIPVVADLHCDYHKPLYFGDSVQLFVKTDEVGNSSFDLHYMALNQHGDICLTGRGRLVYVNATTGQPIPLDEESKEKLLGD